MRRRDGFTLLEVMVALAIAIPALILLYQQAALALNLTGAAFATQDALSRAQSHLSALAASGLREGDREGDDGGAYHWRTRVVQAATLPPGRNVPGQGATLYDVSVAISWPARGGTSSVTLSTRLLGPAEAGSP